MLGGLVEEVDSLQELGDYKENFFKNALNEEAHVDSLLAYYRERVAGLERERHDWLKRYEMVRPRPEDEHRREWDARQSKDAIGLLQKDLSDARQRLFEERQKILKAQAEQTQLKKNQAELVIKKLQLDADVAQTLLQNCSTVEHKVLLTTANKPTVVSKYVNNDLNLKQADKQNKGSSKHHKHPVMKPNERIYTILGLADSTKGPNASKNSQTRGGLTTLTPGNLNPDLSPEETAQRAAAEADFYHSQLPPAERELERRKAQLSGVVRFLTEEYTEKERRYNLEVLEALAKIDGLSESTLKNEKLICDLNKEILKQRIAFEQKQLELSHANETLRRENVEIANQLASAEIKLTGDKRAIEKGIEKDCDKRASKFRTRARESGDKLETIQRQYKEMKDKHKEHTKQLEKQLIELKDKHSTIKRKKEIELSTAMRDWEAAASMVQPCQQAVASADHLSRADKEARIQKLAELLLFSKDSLDAVVRPRRIKQRSGQKKSLQAKRNQSREAQRKKKLNKPAARGALGDPSDQPLKFPHDSVQGRPSDGDLEGAEEMQGGEEATNEEHQDGEYAEGEEEEYYDGMEENPPAPEQINASRPGARPQSAAGGRS